jgi:hypothetical protein
MRLPSGLDEEGFQIVFKLWRPCAWCKRTHFLWISRSFILSRPPHKECLPSQIRTYARVRREQYLRVTSIGYRRPKIGLKNSGSEDRAEPAGSGSEVYLAQDNKTTPHLLRVLFAISSPPMKLQVQSRSGRPLAELEVEGKTSVQELKKLYAKKCMY